MSVLIDACLYRASHAGPRRGDSEVGWKRVGWRSAVSASMNSSEMRCAAGFWRSATGHRSRSIQAGANGMITGYSV